MTDNEWMEEIKEFLENMIQLNESKHYHEKELENVQEQRTRLMDREKWQVQPPGRLVVPAVCEVLRERGTTAVTPADLRSEYMLWFAESTIMIYAKQYAGAWLSWSGEGKIYL